MNLVFVTSFGVSYYDKIAKHTLPTLVSATKDHDLLVYYEDKLCLDNRINLPHTLYFNLFHCAPDLVEFLHLIKDKELYKGVQYLPEHGHLWIDEQRNINYNYRLNAYTFCRKWFAVREAYYRAMRNYENFVLIWVDADVLFHKRLDDLSKRLSPILNRKANVFYLKRDWVHSECGLVLFKSSSTAQDLITRVCSTYSLMSFKKYDEWHDSYIFDRVKEQMLPQYFGALAEAEEGEDVFSKCLFSDYSVHLKGCNKRKLKDYELDEST